VMSGSLASWFRRNRNGPLREFPGRIRRYLGIQVFVTLAFLGIGALLVSDSANSRPGRSPLSLVVGAAFTAGGLIFLWNLVRPH
jgi:hypothetical protein